MSVQIIEQNGKPQFAVLPYKEYLHLIEQAEMLEDIQDYDVAMKAIENGDDELLPENMVQSLINGENRTKVWREFRGLTQQQLAEKSDISIPYLSQIETGKRNPSTNVLVNIAKHLGVDVDDLIKK